MRVLYYIDTMHALITLIQCTLLLHWYNACFYYIATMQVLYYIGTIHAFITLLQCKYYITLVQCMLLLH